MKSISVLALAGIAVATNYPDLVIPYLTTHQPNGDKFSYYHIDFNVTTQTGGAHTAWCWAWWGDNPSYTPVNEWIPCTTEQNGQEPSDISFKLPRQLQIGDFDLALRQNFTENINNTPTQTLTTTSPFHFSNTTSTLPYNCTINPYMNPYNIHASGDCSTTSPLSLPVTASPACQHAKTVTLTFPIQVRTQYGESIYITGSIPELGNWDLSRAVPLNADSYTNEPNGDIWTGGDVKVAAGTSFEWKAVQKNRDGSWLSECGDNWKATVDSYTCGEQIIGNVQTNGVQPTWMRCADH